MKKSTLIIAAVLSVALAMIALLYMATEYARNAVLDNLVDGFIQTERSVVKGVVDCSVVESAIGFDASNFPSTREPEANPTGYPVMSGPVFSPPTQRFILSIYAPILDSSGSPSGTLGAVLYLDEFQEKYFTGKSEVVGASFVLSDLKSGIVLSHPLKEIIGEKEGSPKITALIGDKPEIRELSRKFLRSVKSGQSGTFEFVSSGRELAAAFAPADVAPGTRWALVLTVPVQSLKDAILAGGVGGLEPFQYLLYVAAFLAIASAAFLVYVFNYKVLNPINRLTEKISALSTGNMDVKIDESTLKAGDEVGDLARAFSRVLASLKLAMNRASPELQKQLSAQSLEHEEERERFLRQLRDINKTLNNSSLVSTTDVSGNITYANKKFIEFSKYNEGELSGKNHNLLKSRFKGSPSLYFENSMN